MNAVMRQIESEKLPENIEAEQALLGAILVNNEAMLRVTDFLEPEHFSEPLHGEIYHLLRGLISAGKTANPITVQTFLPADLSVAGLNRSQYLARLAAEAVTVVGARDYGSLVHDLALRRRVIEIGRNLLAAAYDCPPDMSASRLVELAESELYEIDDAARRQGGREIVTIGEAVTEAVDRAAKAYQADGRETGITWGLRDIDRITCGLHPGELTILAGRPGTGKSAITVSVAEAAARWTTPQSSEPSGVLVLSLEMTAESLAGRLLTGRMACRGDTLPYTALRSGRMSPADFERLTDEARAAEHLPILIDETPGLSVTAAASVARRAALRFRRAGIALRLIIVDYLQLLQASDRYRGRKVDEVSEISAALKRIARQENVAVLALSQLSRQVESREDKRPLLSDLRDSGCITGDTLVVDPSTGARRPIKSMVGEAAAAVLTAREPDMKVVAGEASRGFCTGVKAVFRMTLDTGRTIRATANHKFLTQAGWKRLDEITSGDFVATPRTVSCRAGPNAMNADELALLAHMIGDGCALPRHAIQYTTGERELAELVADTAVSIFGDSIRPRISAERSWFQVYLSSAERLARGRGNPVADWMRGLGLFGCRAHEKFVPDRVFQSGLSGICLFLSHLWSTDGHISFREDMRGRQGQAAIFYASSSETLARDVHALLLRVGIVGTIRCTAQPKGRDSWSVHVSGQADTRTFLRRIRVLGDHRQAAAAKAMAYLDSVAANVNRDVIPADLWWPIAAREIGAAGILQMTICENMGTKFSIGSSCGKNFSRGRLAKLAKAIQCAELSALATSDIYWDGVKAIEPADVEEVFDLTVPGPHNFVANDIIIHNSIEQDADAVIFAYRESYYLQRSEPRSGTEEHFKWQDAMAECHGKLDLIIGKQRHGPIGTITVRYDPATNAVSDLSDEDHLRPQAEMF